jgi:hypothetical protein
VGQAISQRASLTSASPDQLYAFYFTADSSVPAYNPRTEFSRQGLGTRTKAWRFTDINKDYSFCPTYPSKLVVPSRISDSTLVYTGKYRSKGRIPALTYLHWANHASITRASQPLVGLKNARSAQDERLIECIFTAHHSVDNPYGPVYGSTSTNLIVDARSTTNAMANVAKGAGTENMDNYRSAKKAYLGIENIHVMRNSLKLVAEAIDSSPPNRSALRKSNWLRHISTLLDGTLVIVRNIHLNASHVLIHCSDGWDRTSQLSATAQICLDPYYRTFEGFRILVEKDWVSFGHKFLDRSGHLSSETFFTIDDSADDDSDEVGAQKAAQAFFASMQKQFSSNHRISESSPVFHQFLDSVRQIQRQFPDRFEFNEDFLIDLHTELYSCKYGTFLFNSEKERSVAKPTVPVWTLPQERHKNSSYNPALDDRTSGDQGVLLVNPKDVRFWHRLYHREDEEMNGVIVAPVQGATVTIPATDPVSDSVDRWKQWSQLSSGALSAISGAATQIKSISHEAINQMRAEASEVDEWTPQANPPQVDPITADWARRSASRKTVRIPSEANPWSISASPASTPNANPWSTPEPSRPTTPPAPLEDHLATLSLADKSAEDARETEAALGGDRKAWDPLGAL